MTNNQKRSVSVVVDESLLIDLFAIGVTWHEMDKYNNRHNPPDGALERLEEWVYQQQRRISGSKANTILWEEIATNLMEEEDDDD
jgi:hypothetical protein